MGSFTPDVRGVGVNHDRKGKNTAEVCATLTAHIDEPGTFWVMVEGYSGVEGNGNYKNDHQGVYELSALCQQGYSPDENGMCAFSFFSCGDSIKGSTVENLPTFLEIPVAPNSQDFAVNAQGGLYEATTGDRVYLLAVDGATEIVLSTCNSYTTVATTIFLLDGNPNLYGKQQQCVHSH